jgi:DNA polymerase-3 subunit delta'
MSARQAESRITVPHPRETSTLSGHREAEAALLNAYRSGRIPHAWLIGGAQGIGKATLAYRMTRFVLAHRNPLAAYVQGASTLWVDPSDAVARQVAASSHGSLLTLERSLNDRGVLRTVITVDETRETISFFGSTAAVDGWRICIVDTVDELNSNAANALLKVLEEPPQQSLFLLISNAPARVLPTILSRCRKLMLRPLAIPDVISAAAKAANILADDPALRDAAEASEGSVSRALTLLGGDAIKLHQQTAALLSILPRVDPRELHALGDAISGSDRVALSAFIDSISQRLRAESANANANLPRLARLAEVWEKINSAARDTESYNLERKPLVFSVFGLLAEAMQ